MGSSGGSYSSQSYGYAPTAPSVPGSYGQQQPQQGYGYSSPSAHPSSYSYGQPPPTAQPYGQPPTAQPYGQPPTAQPYGQPPTAQPAYGQYPPSSYGQGPAQAYGSASFPPGTHPDIIRSFELVDRDRSGFIDEKELQQALSSGYQPFSMGTIRLLMFLFRSPNDSYKIGPKEFAALWNCLGEWRGIFERFDRDRSGKINLTELRDALYSIGYAVPPSVLQLLISKYDDGSGRKELPFDSFVECGLIVKGLTEKFKEKDPGYTGKAMLSYEAFMTMVIPFLVSSK